MPSSVSEKIALLHPIQRKKTCKAKPVLVIHGGAGTMTREGSTPERQEQYKSVLRKALLAGNEVLQNGGEAMDAAVAAVGVMEDCPLFNCGKGAVFNVDGKNELESSIMLSRPPLSRPEIPDSRRGFSLTLLTRTRNPAKTARLLYLSPDSTIHPFLSGTPAEKLAQDLGDTPVDPSYFYTEARWREHRRGLGLPEEPLPYPPGKDKELIADDMMPKGTVGAVALDENGCIATVTSTGGRTNKLAGRIGDTPHMGAGFWADEWKIRGILKRTWRRIHKKGSKQAVGISGTGDGDYFIRYNVAAQIANRMQFLGEGVAKASEAIVALLAERAYEGTGGVIALDLDGNYALALNSSGMYRGVIDSQGIPRVAIFSEDKLE